MTDLHTTIAIGIDKALRDLGAGLVGCAPSMLTGHVIKELREAGLHPSSPRDGTQVQWGWLDAGGGFVVARDEEQARYRTKHGTNRTLATRVVGPAREVTE